MPRPQNPATNTFASNKQGPKMSTWTELNKEITTCTRCHRLNTYCTKIAQDKKKAFADQSYWGKPVPNFGPANARILIIGLAPAAHGANRTGRMFTGDRSGEWLYRALHRAGLANLPLKGTPAEHHAADGLELIDCAITATCHCAPPANKPLPDELAQCGDWLNQTFDILPARVFIALGQIAWRATIDLARARGWYQGPIPKFSHLAEQPLAEGRWLLGSFHPSQQNTFTGKLTEPMFDKVFSRAKELV